MSALGDRERIARAFADACAVWDVRVQLSPPDPIDPARSGHWSGREPLAYIDLETRQVRVNLPLLESIGAPDALTAVLAHEVGHHVRFPHTLSRIAELSVMEKRFSPAPQPGSLLNLFFDLQVNEVVGRDAALRAQLVSVYRGFVTRAEAPPTALFAFYLAIYEALWDLPEGTLIGTARARALEERFEGFRAEARVFVSTFYALGDPRLAFAYFLGRFARYMEERLEAGIPLGADLPAPEAEDVARAITAGEAVDRAIEEAKARGWIEEGEAPPDDPFAILERVAAGRPGGRGDGSFRQVAVEAMYRTYVERHLFELPPVEPEAPEPSLPTTTTEWEPGDGFRTIDWTASVLARGALAAAMPLRRELWPDDPPEREGEGPAVEIYLDTSGSMPDPAHALNAMTLAALVLATAATRADGRVRGVIYSGNHEVSAWMYDEGEARRFLLRYQGGGTVFPFARAQELARASPGSMRVVISDSDFLYNVRHAGADALIELADRSRLLVLLLLRPGSDAAVTDVLGPALRHRACRLVRVEERGDLPGAAAALARAMFE